MKIPPNPPVCRNRSPLPVAGLRSLPFPPGRRTRRFVAGALAAALLLAGAEARAQQPSEEVSFREAPEAWAMKYFASAMLFTGYGAPTALEPGNWTLGMEVVHIPTLDKEEQQVGFGGSKREDLNKAPAIIRPRLTVGLPGEFSATFSYAPPLEVFDAKAALYAASLNRPLWETESFRLGGRVFAQYSHVRGSFTCPEDHWNESDFAPFCSGPSNDRMTTVIHGVELTASYRLDGIPGVRTDLSAFAGVSGQFMDLEFEVDSPRANRTRDNRRLYTDGYTWAATAGLSYPITERLELAGGVFYTRLPVKRPGEARENEPLINGRFQVTYAY